MIKFDDVRKEETKKHTPNWPKILDHPWRILIIGGYGSGKINSLFNLINQQPDIDKFFLCAKDLNEAKYKFLIKKREDVGTNHFIYSKAFINTLIIWMIFIKTLKNTIQIRNVKYYWLFMI